MALVQCLECGREISDRAPVCPGCGGPQDSIVLESDATTDDRRGLSEKDTVPLSAAGRLSPFPEEVMPPPIPTFVQTEPGEAWRDQSPHPWRRFFARSLDSFLNGLILLLPLSVLFYAVSPSAAADFFATLEGPGGMVLDGMLTSYLALPLNALCIGFAGTSYGKWLFGIRVLTADGRVLGPRKAIEREVKVLLMGMGGGIPIVSPIASLMSYQTLKRDGATSWDKTMNVTVLHRAMGPLRFLLAAVGVFAVGLVVAFVEALSEL